MVQIFYEMTRKVVKSWESHLIGIIGLLIASNAYFVQRVISQVDLNTTQVSELRSQMGEEVFKIREQITRLESHWKGLSFHRCKKS